MMGPKPATIRLSILTLDGRPAKPVDELKIAMTSAVFSPFNWELGNGHPRESC